LQMWWKRKKFERIYS